MTAQITEHLADYLAARDRERSERVAQAIAALTDRERALVREAAVMGYVQGALTTGGAVHDSEIPPDTAVLRLVVAACQALPDLYPTISAVHVARGEGK